MHNAPLSLKRIAGLAALGLVLLLALPAQKALSHEFVVALRAVGMEQGSCWRQRSRTVTQVRHRMATLAAWMRTSLRSPTALLPAFRTSKPRPATDRTSLW